MQKETIFLNCAHFIDYFGNVSSFHDAPERCARCVPTRLIRQPLPLPHLSLPLPHLAHPLPHLSLPLPPLPLPPTKNEKTTVDLSRLGLL